MIRLNDLVVWEPLNELDTETDTAPGVFATLTVPSGHMWEVTTCAARVAVPGTGSSSIILTTLTGTHRFATYLGAVNSNQVLAWNGTLWLPAGNGVQGYINGTGSVSRTIHLMVSGRDYLI